MKNLAPSSLELTRVLAYLAAFAVSEAGQQACLRLRPLPAHEAERQAALYEQGHLWLTQAEVTLHPFPDIEGLLRYVEAPAAQLDLDGLWALRQVLTQARDCMDAVLLGGPRCPWPLWVARCQEMLPPRKSMSALARCLTDDGRIRDEASPELSLVRAELRRLHQQCTRKVKDYAVEYNILHYLQDEFMTLSSDRYVLPLKVTFKNRLQGVIHDYSQTGETCYFEPLFLVEVNNRLQELKREEREEERKILIYLTSLVREELVGIRSAFSLLVDLDMLAARMALAACYEGRMVAVADDRGILLREARHPLLALAASQEATKALLRFQAAGPEAEGGQENMRPAVSLRASQGAVPSTLELLPGQKALVISGGNAGGKTVCLKSLGLIALMGMCALPVPVLAGSYLPPWDDLHAFIGDEQNLEDHVSTFTAQITHLARIWESLGPQSLVLLDEFGAGTDPSQGAALAQAVIDSIRERGAFVIAATHFPALKAYALSTDEVRAASVLFDPKTKKPLFRLVYDQVGASQALDVAREHGLPEAVLRKAEQYLLISGEDTTTLVERLNGLAVVREEEIASLAKEKKAFAEKRRTVAARFAEERDRLFADVQKEAQGVLAAWKAGRVNHKQTLKELSRIRTSLVRTDTASPAEENAATHSPVDLQALHVGQRLRHIPWKRIGTLLEVDTRKKRVRLDLDGVSLWADAGDIAEPGSSLSAGPGGGSGKYAGNSEKKGNDSRGVSGVSVPSLPLHLDLRGMRADVAVSTLAKFLDSAILSGRDEVEVIHGRGTGALRRELHAFLSGFPAVARFRLAPEDQGGDGMTIVEMK